VALGGFQAPRTQGSRLLLAALLGLALGVGIALLLERVDRRIRTKEAAETGFALPVLAEVPLGRQGIGRLLSPSAGRLRQLSADAFRLLAAGVMGSSTNGGKNGPQAGGPRRSTPPRTILVTSAGPDEGKSVVVANLARTFAEQGRSVMVLSCDFRRPGVHRLFGVSDEGGLAEALANPNGQGILADHVRETDIGRVRVVPSQPSPEHSGELLRSENMRRALEEARQGSDLVLLDTAPLLTSDAAHLVPEVDAVLVVARAGRTTIEMADRTREFLDRLGAPAVGVALTGTSTAVLPRRYYSRGRWRTA
jgi:capsular exopolysaccharide synthesis family protein